jgi:hypothetical protein
MIAPSGRGVSDASASEVLVAIEDVFAVVVETISDVFAVVRRVVRAVAVVETISDVFARRVVRAVMTVGIAPVETHPHSQKRFAADGQRQPLLCVTSHDNAVRFSSRGCGNSIRPVRAFPAKSSLLSLTRSRSDGTVPKIALEWTIRSPNRVASLRSRGNVPVIFED